MFSGLGEEIVNCVSLLHRTLSFKLEICGGSHFLLDEWWGTVVLRCQILHDQRVAIPGGVMIGAGVGCAIRPGLSCLGEDED